MSILTEEGNLFIREFGGAGIATLNLTKLAYLGNEVRRYDYFPYGSIEYNLTPKASAVHEPATVLLLGTGLAGIGAVVRKRSQAKSE